MGEIKVSPDYNWFRSTVPLKKIIVDDDDSKIWSLYDAGPRSIRCPLIFLPPVSGTADVFFRQILALTGWGYRVIALQYPVYWDHLEFCDGFRKLLDHLQLDKLLADASIYAQKNSSRKLFIWPSGPCDG
uniref:SPG21 abhydrolase domain containing, maspardin n=1 Tax=Prolemur simus TaxID=1328070 RepID=A0A8C8YAX3_PROSS